MYCNQCGQQMEDSAIFCTNCGARLDHGDPNKVEHAKSDAKITEQPVKEPPKVTVDVERTISIAQMYGFDNQEPVPETKADAADDGTTVLDNEIEQSNVVDPVPDTSAQTRPNWAASAQQHHASTDIGQSQPVPQYQPPRQQITPQYQPVQTAYTPQYQSTQNGHNTNYGNTYNPQKNPSNSVSFGKAIQLFFENYVNFTGRASKSEYWWGFLFTFLMSFTIIGGIACYIGMLSLTIRRLHDIGKSWPWIFMGLIPYAGFIILIVYYCKNSVGDNQWGPGPKLN